MSPNPQKLAGLVSCLRTLFKDMKFQERYSEQHSSREVEAGRSRSSPSRYNRALRKCSGRDGEQYTSEGIDFCHALYLHFPPLESNVSLHATSPCLVRKPVKAC